MIARLLVMALAALWAGCSSPRPPPPPPPPAPVDRVELGRRLFSDARLSADGHTSCATCHDPKRAFTDGLPVAHGRNGPLQRNTPTLLNLEARAPYFWDGRARTLEEQALIPITNPQEMGRNLDDLVRLLSDLPEYTAAFGAEGISPDTIARALAAYERTLVSGRSRYDRYLFGERDALTFEELKGLEVFEGKGECTTCHTGPLLTDSGFHNVGVASEDPGRHAIAPASARRGSFKTPSLRDVGRTAPYFHDGSARTLEEVVEHYARGGDPKASNPRDIHPLHLTGEEKRGLVAFLRSLDGT